MNGAFTCLSPDRLRQLADENLSPREWEELEGHLTDCGHCRTVMDDLAADAEWHQELRQAFSGGDDPIGRPRPDAFAGEDAPPEGEGSLQRLLTLLGPTDDPRMMGRIGPYEITGVLGQGGMGVVFKGFDGALNRYVAIKMLLPQWATSVAARKRFAREAQAAAAVVNDHVMAIHAVAEWQGMPYLVMPYGRGVSLQKRLDDTGPLRVAEILRIGMQAAVGLAAAHAQGLVHRDVKPANILLADGVERATLTDFGLARAVDDVSLTRIGVLAGTPPYMSPEQARGQAVDARSDLFSLGSVLYAMCTGQAPFRADSSYGVLRLVSDSEPRSIRDINPEIPGWLCAIVGKLMAKRPEDRFAIADEVAELLRSCLAHLQRPASALDDVSDLFPMPLSALGRGVGEKGEVATNAKTVTESRWLSWLLVLVAALALGSGVACWFVGMDDSKVEQVGMQAAAPPEPAEAGTSLGIWTLAFSPDSKRLVFGGGNPKQPGQFQVWDIAAGKAVIARVSPRGVRAVAFSPDGALLVTGHWNGEIKFRDPSSGGEQAVLNAHANGVNGLAFSPDGKQLASVGLDGKAKIWDVKERREVQTLLQPKGMMFSVAFFHHSHALVTTGDDERARIWNLDTGKESFVLHGHTNKQVEALAISPDDKIVATGSWDSTIKLWDPQTGMETAELHHEEGWVLALAFSPDGQLLASAGSDGRVRIWEVATRNQLQNLRQHGWFARTIAFSPDGKLLASGAEDKTARLWNVATSEDVAVFSSDGAEFSLDTPAGAPIVAAPKKAKSQMWLVGLILGLVATLALAVGVWIVVARHQKAKDKPVAASAASSEPVIQSEARPQLFQCSGCQKKFKVPPKLAGKTIVCPACGVKGTVPGLAMPDVVDERKAETIKRQKGA